MPEVKLSPLEQKLEKLFKDHEVPLPRNLRASLTGLIAGEVMTATGASLPTMRNVKLPPLPDIEKTRYHDE